MELKPVHPLISGRMGEPDVGYMTENLGALPKDERKVIASYLRSCSLILAWMEHTEDLIGQNFGVSGGSAIMSDGTYYWRLDGAEYVQTYGVLLDQGFLDHGRNYLWRAPIMDDKQIADLERYFDSFGTGESQITLTSPDGSMAPYKSGR